MNNEFKKIQVIVENDFATSDKNSEELKVTVFDRAFRKLTHEQGSIGKIFPIYISIDDISYVLGVFALNNNGSTSFFPELPGDIFFDHITIGKSLSENNAHLTQIIEGERKKVSPIKTDLFSNGTYHLITFIFQDFNILKLTPKEVRYPLVDTEQIKLLQDALITKGGFNGSGRLNAIGTSGIVVIQFFLLPKGVDYRNMQFVKSPLDPIAKYFEDEKIKGVRQNISYLKHEFQDEYQFGILTVRFPIDIHAPAYLGYGVDKSGFYFNSSDEELKTSVIKNAKGRR